MKRIIVVGAGASGMLAAITAARRGASVTVLEAMEKPGKKLLLTGSGRCNLTNLCQEDNFYHGADILWIKQVLSRFPVDSAMDFFREIGLFLTDRNGYVYPLTGQSSSVLEVLLLEMRRLGVKLKCLEKVTSIVRSDASFQVTTDSWTYEADAVVLTAGSKAAPGTGSDGSGYRLAMQCGHSIKDPLPALVPLKIRESWVRRLGGVRMPAKITVRTEPDVRGSGQENESHTEYGELQWTDYGISGIAVFQLSRYAVRALSEKKRVSVILDLLPSVTEKELYQHFFRRNTKISAAEMLAGKLPQKSIAPLLEYAGLSASAAIESISEEALQNLAHALKHVFLTVSGFKSFEQAQTCQGGVDCREVRPETLESLQMPGLYFAGEILDVDGSCGGYNLQWAWASGFVAGFHAGAGKESRFL